ncbi:hypothetical protein BV20DRAFT_959894 [Pilatotrama ljubarskyi]|nr:hypothetical protein BV20DRAFT_959894 [Pilatotrama ljubarskyi]
MRTLPSARDWGCHLASCPPPRPRPEHLHREHTSAPDMSEAMKVENAMPAPAPVPAALDPPPVAEGKTLEEPVELHAEVMAILAKTQNKCFAEMGYYPTLLQEFRELQKQCALLKSDNQKLYSDNRSLAQFIQAQDQRIQMLVAPVDQQKRTLAELHEHVRSLSAERDEIKGRLHAALNEVMILRQELSRFIPAALVMPAHERMPSGPPQHVSHQRMVSTPTTQQMVQEHPPNLNPYMRQSPPQQPQHRPIQPLPARRPSHPALSPIDTSAPPPITHLRRTSAPAPLAGHLNGAGPSSASPSPLNRFNGLSLASPATPMSSRPSTANAPGSAPPRGLAPQPLTGSTRSIHMIPVQPQNVTPSSLAGAIIDLTNDESQTQDGARKRRKTEHTPESLPSPTKGPATQYPSPMTPTTGHTADHFQPSAHPAQASVPHPNPMAPLPVQPSHEANTPNQPAPLPVPLPLPSASGDDVTMDQQTTVEEDCLEANFEDDEEDENKLWCTMCRSRYKAGHTTEPPQPFIGASQEELIAHCESVHPHGWGILKERVAEQRAAESEPV